MSKSAQSLKLKANSRPKVKKLRALLLLRTPTNTTLTTSSNLTLASMDSAVVSVLMLSTLDQPVESVVVLVESMVLLLAKDLLAKDLLAKDKPKPLLGDRESAKVKSKLPVKEMPAADLPSIMLGTPKLTAPVLTVTTPLSLLLTVLQLLPELPEALPLDVLVIVSMAFVLNQTAPELTATTPPLLPLTKLPLLPLLPEALAETSHLAIDSVPDKLTTSVLNRPAPLLTAETHSLLTPTLSDLKDPPLLSLLVAIAFSMALPSVDNPSASAAATLPALEPTKSTPTVEMLLLLASTDFLRLPMTQTVPLLASTEPLSSVLLLSANKLLMSSLLVSLVTATAILPEATVVFLRFVNPLSAKIPQLLLLLLAPATSNTDMLLTLTLDSTAEARLVTATLEVVPLATVPDTDMVSTDGEFKGTGTSNSSLKLFER